MVVVIHVVVPVKSNSERVPQKNTRIFASKSLWLVTVEKLLNLGLVPIVSSEAEEVLLHAEFLGCKTHIRSPWVSGPEVEIVEVLSDLVDNFRLPPEDFIALFQVTSPLRGSCSIKKFLKETEKNLLFFDVFFSATKDFGDYWYKRDMRFERVRNVISGLGSARDSKHREPLYRENGLYYAFNVEFITKRKSFSSSRVSLIESLFPEDLDVNNILDFEVAETLYMSELAKKQGWRT